MSQAAEPDILDPRIPLCFDTNAVFGPHAARRDLQRIRATFSARKLLLPSVVVAERARQLRAQHREGFNWQMIRNFLDDPYLGLEVVAFVRDTVVPLGSALANTHSSWLQVVGHFDEAEWDATERARFADHAVYAMARQAGAILVTNDGPLRHQAERDAYRPGTIEMDALLRACG